MKFRTKFVILFISFILIQGVFVGYFSYRYAKNISLDSRKENTANMVNLIDININTKIKYINESINDMQKDTLMELLNNENEEYFNENLNDSLNNMMEYLQRTIGNINSIMILNNDNLYYRNANFKSISKFKEKHFIENELLEKVKKSPGTLYWYGVTDPFISYTVNSKDIILTSYGLDKNRSIAIEFSTDSFTNLIPIVEDIFKNQNVFILDKYNNIIVGNKAMSKEELSFVHGLDKDNSEHDFSKDGKEFYYQNQYNGMTGWKTYALMPKGRAFSEDSMLQQYIVYFVLLSVIIFSIMAYIISYGLTKPLDKLVQAMDNAENSKYTVQVENNRNDEIGLLTESFNLLIKKIKNLINDVYIGKIAQKNSEIEALESQINPHFLYNTLDSMNWMLIEKEEYEISDVVVSLGNILKYSMDRNNSIVELSKEIENINSYLYIQKNRFEDKLTYCIEIPEDVLRVKVPKLILQPIIENSIIHGIDSKYHDMNINIIIDGYVDKKNAYIVIVDNGKGIEKNKLDIINKYLVEENYELNSMGLKNINKRIKLYFGNKYGIKIFSDEDGGTKVVIKIPKEGEYYINENNDYR